MPFVIDVDPVIATVGPIAIRWYSLALLAAVAATYVLTRRATRRAGIPDAIVADGAFWVGVGALAGGRGLYLVQNDLPMLAAHPFHAFEIWNGGLSFLGGLIVAIVVLVIYARRHDLEIGVVADAAAPAAAIGQAIGHLGCLITGDSSGIPTTLPWAVVYRNPAAMAPLGVPVHPTQAYEAIALLVLAWVLWAVRDRVQATGGGALAALYVLGVAGIRFGLFFLRDEQPVLAGLRTAQLLSVPLAVGAAAFLAWLVTHRPNPLGTTVTRS